MTFDTLDPPAPPKKLTAWLPYLGLLVLIGGWIYHFGQERAEHQQLADTVKKLAEQQRVTNVINYSEHHDWWASILAAEKTP